jgi:hypothetical protein
MNQRKSPEKRKLERRHLIYYLRVYGKKSKQMVGHVVNITKEGIMLISEDPIETDGYFQFRMALPEAIKESREISFEAKSVWCKKDNNPEFYNTGFRLTKISIGDLQIIEKLTKDFSR